jgi:hypothetical protein
LRSSIFISLIEKLNTPSNLHLNYQHYLLQQISLDNKGIYMFIHHPTSININMVYDLIKVNIQAVHI